MLRIKTVIGTGKVYTLFHQGLGWVTILTYPNGKTGSIATHDFRQAGENHLNYSLDLHRLVKSSSEEEEKDTFAF